MGREGNGWKDGKEGGRDTDMIPSWKLLSNKNNVLQRKSMHLELDGVNLDKYQPRQQCFTNDVSRAIVS